MGNIKEKNAVEGQLDSYLVVCHLVTMLNISNGTPCSWVFSKPRQNENCKNNKTDGRKPPK